MLLLASLISLCLAQIITPGAKCPKIPLIADFDVPRYGGKWYEQIRYPVKFQDPKDKCVTATYGVIDATTISVNNTQVVPAENNQTKLSFITGKADQVEPDTFPNKLYVSFNYPDSEMTNNVVAGNVRSGSARAYSNYNVMETDYGNYTIVMSCRDNGFYSIEYGWILSKNQAFRKTDMFKEVLQKAITKFGFKFGDKTIEAPQEPEDCKYDYVEYYPDGPTYPITDPDV